MFNYKNKLLVFLILLFSLLFVTNGIGADKNKNKSLRILFLPFENYSNSDMKFLSRYLSEKLKDNFTPPAHAQLLDYLDLPDFNTGLNYVYGKEGGEAVFDLMGKTKVDIAISGRFIVYGNNISIDWSVYDLKKRSIRKGPNFTGLSGDHILTSIDDFSDIADEWIGINILKEAVGTEIIFSKKDILKNVFNKINNSPFAIVVGNKWSRFVLTFIFFLIVAKLLVFLMEKIFIKILSSSKAEMVKNIADFIKKKVFYILILLGFKISSYTLETSSSFVLWLDNVISAIIIFLAAGVVAKALSLIIHGWGKKVAGKLETRIDEDLVPLFDKFSKVIIYSVAFIMILSSFHINIAPLVASLGIAGFAIGFAVKDTLSNIIGGVILILDNSFVVGDKVEIDGDLGIIKEVGIRNTKLQTYDNEVIVIPNGELMNMKFKNYVLPDPQVRVVVPFGVAYGSDIAEVSRVVIEAIKKMDDILEDPEPGVDFLEMADFSLNCIAKFWVPAYGDQYIKKVEATGIIYKALNENNIDIPFPTNTVYLNK